MRNLDDIVFYLCVTLLIVLFAGDPDLMDAIVEWVRSHA
jgi:hypothetical protein